jgi:DNA-binding CsgD family transcriptional regulator
MRRIAMARLENIGSAPIPPAVLAAHEAAVEVLGSEKFVDVATAAVESLTHVDRFYVFDICDNARQLRPLIHRYEPEKPPVADGMYARQFLPTDPVKRAIDTVDESPATWCVRVAPSDIIADRYRRMLESSGIVERVSFIRRARHGWRCMTVARRAESGPFGDQEVDVLGGFARLLMPMIERNDALAGQKPLSTEATIEELEARFARLFPALTRRERETCARAAVGMTAEGAALDLNIGVASVLTYRKRAYQRLGVSSAYELSRLVMR